MGHGTVLIYEHPVWQIECTFNSMEPHFLVPLVAANSGMYAHYVFNTLDQSRRGVVSFEVSEPKCCYCVIIARA